MKFSNNQYAQALYDSLHETAPESHDTVIVNFISILKTNNDLHKYEEIITAYEQYDQELRGIKNVEVTMARNIDINEEMIQKLNQIVGADTTIKKKVDGGILGGVVVKVDDTLLDGSIKTQLDKLKRTLS